jgi:hypothetical protein
MRAVSVRRFAIGVGVLAFALAVALPFLGENGCNVSVASEQSDEPRLCSRLDARNRRVVVAVVSTRDRITRLASRHDGAHTRGLS